MARASERTLHEFEVANLRSSVHLVRSFVAHELASLPLLPEACEDLLAAVQEAAGNAAVHGPAGSEAENTVLTRIVHEPEAVRVEVRDHGVGFHPDVDAWPMPDLDAESGRGIFLMRALVDEVRYPYTDGGTLCVLVKRLDADGPGDGSGATERTVGNADLERGVDESLRLLPGIYRSLVEKALEGVWVIDAMGTAVFVNDRAAKMLGYERREMLGRQVVEFLSKDSRLAYRAVSGFERVGQSAQIELELLAKDGHSVYVVAAMSPVTDDADRYAGSLALLTDVTDRKRAEQKLADIAARNASLFDNTSDGVCIHDLDGHFLEVNDATCRMTGYRRDQLLGMNVADLEAEESPEEVLRRARRLILGGGHDRFESRYRRQDGTVFDADVTALYLGEEADEVAMFFRDITERKRLEMALREAETQSRELIRYAPTGIYEIDFLQRRFKSVNDAMCRLSGYSREELLAMDPFQILDEEGRTRFAERITKALAGDFPDDEVEYRVFKKDGSEMFVVLNIRFLSDERGVATGALVIGHDVTERRRADEERARRLEEERAARREEHRRARLAEALNEIDNHMHSSLEYPQIIGNAVSSGAQALRAYSSALSIYGRGRLVVQYAHGFPGDIIGMSIPEEREPHSMIALQTCEVILIEDVCADERVVPEHLLPHGIRAVIVVPLVVNGVAIACLYFNFSRPRRFSMSEVEFARRVGTSLSLALENARLFEEQRAEARVHEALGRLAHTIHATLDPDEMLRSVAEESDSAIGADGTFLCLREGDDWIVRYSHNTPGRRIGEGFRVDDAPYVAIAASTERPVSIEDAYEDQRANRAFQEKVGVRAQLMAPLIVRDEVIGGIFFDYREPHRFGPHDMLYASQLASSVGLAIANIRLYEEERDIAERLQSAMLTMPERIPGVEFSHAYRSATEAARVGGDFYDAFELSHAHVGITIGDVAGKGLDAAVLTSLAKNTIRAHASERGKTPSRVLTLTNEALYRSTPPDSFVTVFFGLLDLRDGRLVYASAGHTSTILVCRDGTRATLPPTGPLLGAMADVTFRQGEVRIEVDDLLLLYTDGLTEARRGPELYGENRVVDLACSMGETSTANVVDRVMEDVLAFSGGRLRDDIAVLALKRREDEAPATQLKMQL